MTGRTLSSRDPQDGGWGWVVVLSSFICGGLTAGTNLAFGVLYVAFLDAFGESKATTAWIGSIFAIVIVFTSSLGLALSRKIGHRKTVMLAGVVAFTGFLTSSFVTHIAILYFTFGVLTGIGLGLSYMPSIEMVSIYFKRRFPIAIGIALSGTGAGQFVFALLCQYLIDTYGWRGTLLILSALSFNLSVAGALLRPLGEGKQEVTFNTEAKSEVENVEIQKSVNRADIASESGDNTDIQIIEESKSEDKEKSSCIHGNNHCNILLSSLWDLSLFHDPLCWCLMVISMCQGISQGTVLVHMVSRALDYGISSTYSAMVPAVMGLAQVIAIPIMGAIGNIRELRAHIPYGTSMAVCGTITIISTYTRTFTGQTIFIVVFGLSFGGIAVFIAIVVSSFLGAEKIGYGTTLCIQVQGITVLLAAPLSGWIRDETNVYDGAFWMAGVSLILAASVAFMLPAVEKMGKRRYHQGTLVYKEVQTIST
ncbi:monocarboxylate transporter 13-like isoform X1 [Glandiceps talaboti]